MFWRHGHDTCFTSTPSAASQRCKSEGELDVHAATGDTVEDKTKRLPWHLPVVNSVRRDDYLRGKWGRGHDCVAEGITKENYLRCSSTNCKKQVQEPHPSRQLRAVSSMCFDWRE